MEKNRDIDHSRWVDDRLAPPDAAIDWQPDLEQGLLLLRESRQVARVKTKRRIAAAAAVMVFLLSVLAFPVTRVLANRCVGACVAGANQFSGLLLSAFSSPEAAGISLDQLPGTMAPDFTAIDNSGATVRLSDLKGKIVVLNFWATWCAPCTHETPWFVEFQQKYRDAGLVVIGISLDEDRWTSVKPFMVQMGVNYPMIVGNERISHLYGGMDSLPATVIVDRSGRVVSAHVGLIAHDDFESGLKAMLNEQGKGL